MNKAAAPLVMSTRQREALAVLARSSTAAHREVQRAKVLLMAGQGVANSQIAVSVGVTPVTVRSWRARFASEGLAKFGVVRAGRGRKAVISAQKVEEIVRLTQHETPSGATHWSCRSMAKAVGVSPATVQRIWSGRGLKPHLVKTFKLSRNGNFRRDVFDDAAVAAGLDGLTPHELRHTAASLAVSAGANVKAVQRMLGHASAAMTSDVYAGLFDGDLDGVGDRMDEARVYSVCTQADVMPMDRKASKSENRSVATESV